jgi:RpiR family transcriptional regulator, carbohydrate utilization regulator
MILDTIRRRQDTLAPTYARVARAVLRKPGAVVDMSIQTLAAAASVSEPTVLRFARHFGFAGWAAFKLQLARDLAVQMPRNAASPTPRDLARDLIDKILSRSMTTLLDLRNGLDAAALDRAIAALAGAGRIEIYGQGTSAIVAMDAQHKLFRSGSGIACTAYTDASVHPLAAALLSPRDVVIAISQRGTTPALLQSVRSARGNGAFVVAIAPSGTPLAALASALLAVDQATDADPYTPISSRLAHLAVIDMLAVGMALRAGPQARRRVLKAAQTLGAIDVQFETFLGLRP